MKIYEKNWFIILMLVLFFPVGLFLMWKNAKWHKTVKIIVTALIVVMAIFSNGSEKPKNVETKDTNAEVETVKVDERKELQEKSKTILDSKDYYAMNEDERKTINELVKKWDDEIDYSFKSEYVDKKDQYEKDKYYDENYRSVIISNVKYEVKKQLKSPKSADFPWNDAEYKITYKGKSNDGLYEYTVESYVDAENSFGAEIRSEYTCVIHVTEDLKQYRAVVIFNE